MHQKQKNRNISRLMALLLVFMLLVGIAPAVYADGDSGSCGDNLAWSLSAGKLTITGSGDMADFLESTMAPWYHRREEILSVELPQGLTSIGMLAFYGCENLTAVVIPDSVTTIGSYAFANCTGMTMLTMGSAVETVGESAFSDCVSLMALQLPGTLRSIGVKAFYRCESIPAVTVPESVTGIGMSAFAYCKGLVSARVDARIDTLPEWLFYGCQRLTCVTLPEEVEHIDKFTFRGCDQLTTVSYGGTTKSLEEIQEIISQDVPGFDGTGHVTDASTQDTVISGSTHDNGDSTVTQENVTVTQDEDMTVTVTVETTIQEDGTVTSTDMDIQVTIENEQGWDKAEEVVTEALKDYNNNGAWTGAQVGEPEIIVFVKDAPIRSEFVDMAAGRDVTMTILSQDNSGWRLDGNQLENRSEEGQYDLRYALTAGSAELCEELGVASCYVLRFFTSAQINAEMLIRLGPGLAHQNATLLQRLDEMDTIQSVVVDQYGDAHFYLASVSGEIEYYIAMNKPGTEQQVIIPQELQAAYGKPERHSPIQYEITGVKSSWGMSLGHVTGIMAAVMVLCIAAVGVVMFSLNKRKLKAGYIPDFDGDELE